MRRVGMLALVLLLAAPGCRRGRELTVSTGAEATPAVTPLQATMLPPTIAPQASASPAGTAAQVKTLPPTIAPQASGAPCSPFTSETTSSSADRAAQAVARNTLTTAKSIYTDTEDYRQATPDKFEQAQPEQDFVDDGCSRPPNLVSVKGVSESEFRLAVLSRTGMCWALRDEIGSGVSFGKAAATDCRATRVPTAAFAGAW